MEQVLNALSKSQIPELPEMKQDLFSIEPQDGRLIDIAINGFHRGYESGFTDLGRRFCTYKINTGQFDHIPGLKNIREELDAYEGKFNKPFGYLITINPREGTDRDIFISKIDKWLDKSWVHECVVGIEYRDKDSGLHAHIYVRYYNKRYSEVKRETISTFNKFIGNNKHVDIRRIKKEDETQTVNYVVKDKDLMGKGEVFKSVYMPKPPEIIFEE